MHGRAESTIRPTTSRRTRRRRGRAPRSRREGASRDEAGADERPFEWVDGSGCDAWILAFSRTDPLEHAAGWNDFLEDEPERYGAALDAWTSHFAAQGIGCITEGAVLLRRREGD